MFKKLFLIALLGTSQLWAQGSALLVGGGAEDYGSWSDIPYGWFVQQADSGKIINIDASSASDWYPSYFKSLGASDAEALQISNRTEANDSSVYKKLIEAGGIFMEGGDQYDYVSNWKGTLVGEAIHYVFSKGGAIGGTSAGLAVLGDVVFDAKFGSSYPEQAAYNAYHPDIHLEDDFLHILPDILTDSHFHSRGRMGRLVPMLAQRIQDDGDDNITGIGVADKTALCIEPDGRATAWGHGTVTILYKTENSVVKAEAGKPVLFTHIGFDQLVHGAVYDLNSRQVLDGGEYMDAYAWVEPPTFTYPDTVLNGSDASLTALGDVDVRRLTGSELNAWNGNLRWQEGNSTIPGTVIIPQLYDDNDYYENRFVGGMWAATENPGLTVIWADNNNSIAVSPNGDIKSDKILYVLETYGAAWFGVNGFEPTNYCGIAGARLHFIDASARYNLNNRFVTSLEKETPRVPRKTMLYPAYPNPFNPQTRIRFFLPRQQFTRISVFDNRGSRVKELHSGDMAAGEHTLSLNAEDLASGVYYLHLRSGGFIATQKLLLLR